jgi:hypothetical protein
MGMVFRLSKTQFVRLMRAIIKGRDWDLYDYGKHIATIDEYPTDLTPEGARSALSYMKKKGRP